MRSQLLAAVTAFEREFRHLLISSMSSSVLKVWYIFEMQASRMALRCSTVRELVVMNDLE